MLDETSKAIEKKCWEKRLNGKTCSSDTMLKENVWSFSRGFVTPLGTLEDTEKSATKNMQLLLQHCCKTSWLEMLRVLPLTSNMLCNKSGCCVLPSGWQNAQRRFSTRFAAIIAKQVARFCCPFYRSFSVSHLLGPNWMIERWKREFSGKFCKWLKIPQILF